MASEDQWIQYETSEQCVKAQFLLNLIMATEGEGKLAQLAIMTEIRKLLAKLEDKIDVKGLLSETNILTIVDQVLAMNDQAGELVRFLKLEATWVLTNIGYGQEADIL